VSVGDRLLDRAVIEAALIRLSGRLHHRGVTADVYVVGGAAMTLAYDARLATRDIDAVFTPHGAVIEEAAHVATELGLPRWWLNDQASVYVSPLPDSDARAVFDSPALRVSAASPEHRLAMKVLAARRYADREDIGVLLNLLQISTAAEVERICARVFPQEPLTPASRLLVEDVLDEVGRL